ncbi:MAG: hypothetical protein IPJ37_15395 [Bacteroidales bacterium]|nr:hypothetical protein [Bacteroidales bacterium]
MKKILNGLVIMAECIRLDCKSFQGITEIDFQGIYGYGFYPDKVRGEGFFISAIRKKGKQEELFIKSSRQSEFIPAKSDLKVAAMWTDFKGERILKWGDETIAVPCPVDEYFYLFRNLRIVKAGTRISVTKQSDNIPSHDLALSLRLKKDSFPAIEISLDEAISYLRRDNIKTGTIPIGWNIVTFKGINLGFIKNIGSRINNYFPVEWRIRLDASAIMEANPIKWSE